MSKKVTNEKEIYKARVERRWDDVIEFTRTLNLKTASGNLTAEELELYVCFLLGEALFEKCIDQYESVARPSNTLTKEELNAAFGYLSAAINAVKKVKSSFPFIFQDAHMLISKYHYMIKEYELCVKSVDSLDPHDAPLEWESLPKRSRYIKAETLTCKALSLEALNNPSTEVILTTYNDAGKLVNSLCLEDEKNAALKRVTSAGANNITISNLLSNCFFRPANILIHSGKVTEAIQCYRQFLRGPEYKATSKIRKSVCRSLAEVLLSYVSSVMYVAPIVAGPVLPVSDSTLSLSRSTKRSASVGETFSPKDEVEEAVLTLLLSEVTLCFSTTVSQRKEDAETKKLILNESSVLFDLLVLVFSRRDQYNTVSRSFERVMKLAFEAFHLWFQYGLTAACSGKYNKALLILEQCHKLQPKNTDVLLVSVKLCINHLQKYDTAIHYANKVLEVATDHIVEGSAHLAIGISQTHLACKDSKSGKTQNILQDALTSLETASKLCPGDAEVQFNLAFCQALTKQLQSAMSTIKSSLLINHDHLPSLNLLALLLSAQKKYGEALEVIETAIDEYPQEFNLLTTKIKLSEECYGSHVALVVCHYALLLWNDLYNKFDSAEENNDRLLESSRSPSAGFTSKPTESKFFEGTPSIKSKRSLHDSIHLDTPMLKKISDSASLLDDDNGSIAASIRIERTLSVASESVHGNEGMTYSAAVSFLCKLWLITAECFINIGDLTEAMGCILEASSIFPLSPEVLYMRGRYNEAKGIIPEAKACYESALSVLPAHKAASQRLGLLHLDEGNHVLAEKLLRGCILQDSGNHTAWNDLGLVLESVGRYEVAGDCFMTSLLLESTAPIIPYTTIPRLFSATDYS